MPKSAENAENPHICAEKCRFHSVVFYSAIYFAQILQKKLHTVAKIIQKKLKKKHAKFSKSCQIERFFLKKFCKIKLFLENYLGKVCRTGNSSKPCSK